MCDCRCLIPLHTVEVADMKENLMRHWVLTLFFCFIALHAHGKTWQVERDGSGDFAVIQDCVDASASGDTLLIGSGRYNEWQFYGGDLKYTARVMITDKDLTIIGENDGSSVIGPAGSWEPGTNHHGIVLMTDSSVVIRNISMENLFGGILSWLGGDFVVVDCTFRNNLNGLYLQEGNGLLEACSLSSSTAGGTFLFSNFQESLVVRNCTMDHVDHIEYPNIGIIVQGCPKAQIENCVISGNRVGIQFDFNTKVKVSNTRIYNNPGPAVRVGLGQCSLQMFDCFIENSQTGVRSTEVGNIIIIESTVFTEVERATFSVNNLSQGYIRDCILAKGERGVLFYRPHLKSKGGDSRVLNDFNMRGNYWGTDNPDSIQAWIEDNSDDPDINYRILWEPFNGGPVSSEPSTLGSFKSIFR